MIKHVIRFIVLLVGVSSSALFAAAPTVHNDSPSDNFVGEGFCYSSEFTNSSVDIGYGPYYQLVLNPDLKFNSADFKNLGINVLSTETFPAGGTLTDPVSEQTVNGTPDGQLVILEIPVGSVSSSQAPLSVDICLDVANGATPEVLQPNAITLVPGFQFGDSATGSRGTDTILGPPDSNDFTPRIITYEVNDTIRETENPPGPAWTYPITAVADIASDRSVAPIVFPQITLPGNVKYSGPMNITGGSGCTFTPDEATLVANSGNGSDVTIDITCTSGTGTIGSSSDITVDFDVYITDTLDNMSCSSQSAINSAKHLALQKSASGSGIPGSAITYTYSYQTSEFIPGINDFRVSDTLQDGISYLDNGSGQVILTVNHQGTPATTLAVPIGTSGNNSVFTNADILGAITAAGGSIGPAESGTISYQAVIDQNYNNGNPVLTRDTINNDVIATYGISGANNASNCTEDSNAQVTIEDVSISKATIGNSVVKPGDVVQFRLTMEIPSGDADDVELTDVLPLPVFDATAFPSFTGDLDTYPGSAAAGNYITYGPGSYEASSVSVVPQASSNSLLLSFGDIDTNSSQTIVVDVYARATDDAYTDGLSLTNLLTAKTNNTNIDSASDTTGTKILVRAPNVQITKEILNPTAPPDAGDTIDYRITLANVGGAPAFDVTVTDIFGAGINTSSCTAPVLSGGSGAYTGTLAGGLTLDNSLPATGAGLGEAGSGTDVATIDFSCDLESSVAVNTTINNQAQLVFAAGVGAPSFPMRDDDANIVTRRPSLAKTLVATSEADSGVSDGRGELAVGEVARFRIETEIPEGTNANVSLIDLLPNRLIYRDDGTAKIAFVSNGANISSSTYTPPSGCTLHSTVTSVTPDCDINASGSPFTAGKDPVFDLGTLVNSESDSDLEYIILEFNAYKTDSGAANVNFANRGRLSANGTNFNSPNLNLKRVDPVLTLDKRSDKTTGDAGEVINYTLDIVAPTNSPATAFEITLSDVLPSELTYQIGSGTFATCPASATKSFDDSDPYGAGINLTISQLAAGESCSFTYSGNLNVNVMPGQRVTNTATLEWTSLLASGSNLANSAPGPEKTYTAVDSVEVLVDGTASVKSIVSTSLSHTSEAGSGASGSPRLLSIGETIKYRLVTNIPQGTANDFVIRDNLPNGLEYINSSAYIAFVSDGGLSSSMGGSLCSGGSLNQSAPTSSVTPNCAITPTLGASGNSVDFNLGNITNSDVDSNAETVIVEFEALAINQLSNQQGTVLSNSFEVLISGRQDSISTTVDAQIVEPQLSLTATATPNPVDNRVDTSPNVNWDLVLTNTGLAQAFQVQDGDSGNWQVALPSGVKDISGVNVTSSGNVVLNSDLVTPITNSNFTVSGAENNILTIDSEFSMEPGASLTISFSTELDPSILPGTNLSSDTDLDYAGQQSGNSSNDVREFSDISSGTGNDPINNDSSPLNNYRTESPISVDTVPSTPVIGIAKELVSSTFVPSDGSFNLVYRFYVENSGDVHLENVQVTDDLAATFNPDATFSITSLTAAMSSGSGTIEANDGTFDGSSNTDLLVAANSSLEIGSVATIDLALNVQPGSNLRTYSNNARASGDSVRDPSNSTTDDSVDGNDPDPEGDGPDNNTSNTNVTLSVNPSINIAKAVNGSVTNNNDGSYTIDYRMVVKNTGDVDLNDVQVVDNLASTFSGATFTVSAGSPTSPELTINSAYDGDADSNLLATNQSLVVGDTATIDLQVTVRPGSNLGPYNNTAVVSATSPNGNPPDDDSDNGLDPETDNGSGGFDDPTPVSFTEAPEISVAKAISGGPTNNNDGTYDLSYSIVVQNTGDISLSDVQLVEDLATTFAGASFTVSSVSAGNLATNTSFDGSSDTNLLATNQSLAVGDSDTIEVNLVVTPGTNLGPYDNQVTAEANSPSGNPVTDLSDAGTDPTTDNGSGGTDDPTPVTFTEAPAIGVAKAISSGPTNLGDGSYELSYSIVVQNTGDIYLSDVQVVDDLDVAFAGASYTVSSVSASSLSTNGSYDGSSDTNLLAANQSLAVGVSDTIVVNLVVTPSSNLGPYENQATASGASPSGANVNDLSDAGTDPTTDNGSGGTDDPTPVTFTEAPAIGLAKAISSGPTNLGDGTYELSYSIVVQNTGDVNLSDVQVVDDLVATFAGASFTVSSVSAGSLSTNGNYDGSSDTNLLALNQALDVGMSDTIVVDLVVTPGANLGPYNNQATGSGTSPSGAGVNDLSDAGTDPTTDNGNGSTDDPTPVTFVENPRIGIAKTVSGEIVPTESGSQGNFDVPFRLVIQNIGDVNLNNLQIVDDLQDQLGDAYVSIIESPQIVDSTAQVDPNIATDFPANILDGNSGLLTPGQQLTVEFIVEVDPSETDPNNPFTNQAEAQAYSPASNQVTDLSDSGDNPTDEVSSGGHNEGFPGDTGGTDDPTPFDLPTGALQGNIWLDVNADDVLDEDENLLAGWIVEVYDVSGDLIATVQTDSNGYFNITELPQGDYQVNVITPTGTTFSQETVTVPANVTVDVPVPVDPSGIVYDSISREPVPGTLVSMVDESGNPIPEVCLLPGQQNQITADDGFYFFLLLLDTNPACPSGGEYFLEVTAPEDSYQPGPSDLIPAQSGSLDPTGLGNPYSVGLDGSAPEVGEDTTYYMQFVLSDGDPDVINNHVPVDQIGVEPNLIRLTKVAEIDQVVIGDLVRYRVTVENLSPADITDLTVVDQIPAGFTYVQDSAAIIDEDNQLVVTSENPLTFDGIDINGESSAEIIYILRVGAGVARGEHVNRVSPYLGDINVGNEATAAVIVGADPDFEEITILGKVFDDRDSDNWQDSANASGVMIKGGFNESVYVNNSTLLVRGDNITPIADASSPLVRGVEIGEVLGRTSIADKAENHQVIVRQELTALDFNDALTLTSDEGSVVTMDSKGNLTKELKGELAEGRGAQDLNVTRKVSLLANGHYQVDYIVRNEGIQEIGVPGVRVATVEGIYVETDLHGRFHLAAVDVANFARGRNFYMKVDSATLPKGTEFVSENPRVKRVTQGVPARFDFAVKLPLEVLGGSEEKLEMNIGELFFEPGSADINDKYLPLIEQIAEKVNHFDGGQLNIIATASTEALAVQRADSIRSKIIEYVRVDLHNALTINIKTERTTLMSIGEKMNIGTLFFDNDKAVIKAKYQDLLSAMAERITNTDKGELSIVGYTDSNAGDDYNVKLGLRRANAVLKALKDRIPKEKHSLLKVEVYENAAELQKEVK